MKVLQRMFFMIACLSLIGQGTAFAQEAEWSYSPNPNNTVLQNGDTVTICIDLTEVELSWSAANWFHGVELILYENWDFGDPIDVSTPDPCWSSGGEFLWINDLGVNGIGSGWFFDGNTGGPMDGDPTNNWGAAPCSTDFGEFCVTLALPTDITGFETYSDGQANAAPAARATPDGLTGSWFVVMPPIDLTSAPPLMVVDCNAQVELISDSVFWCPGNTFSLFDNLTGLMEPNGVWTGPDGELIADANFVPGINQPGTYTYFQESEDCTFSRSFYINDGSINQEVEKEILYYENVETSLNLFQIEGIEPGQLGYPGNGFWENPLGQVVENGIITWPSAIQGTYTYIAESDAECLLTYTAELVFSFYPNLFNPGSSFKYLPYDLTITSAGLFEADTLPGLTRFYNQNGATLWAPDSSNESLTLNDLDGDGTPNENFDYLPDGFAVNFVSEPLFEPIQDTVFYEVVFPEDCDTTYIDTISICTSFDLSSLLPDTFCTGGEWYDPQGGLIQNGMVSGESESGIYEHFNFTSLDCPCSANLYLEIILDSDNDGVCDIDEVIGCQDPTAVNYDPLATDEGLCEYDWTYPGGDVGVYTESPEDGLFGRPDFKLFPNPTRFDDITLRVENEESKLLNIQIHDVFGRMLLEDQFTIGSYDIPRSIFESEGVYSIVLFNGSEVMKNHLVITR